MTETAIFAAGCFWGVEAEFRRADGVTATRVGYTGGRTEHPTYRQVCGRRTGHAEAVEVTFDPERVSYDELLERFWAAHDPTTKNRQGAGPRLPVPLRDLLHLTRAAGAGHPVARRSSRPSSSENGGRGLFHHRRRIVTEITPAATFWPAEDYHQRYLEKQGRATCNVALRY